MVGKGEKRGKGYVKGEISREWNVKEPEQECKRRRIVKGGVI